MRILVCGGRNFGHVVRAHGLTVDEPPEMQERLAEYKFIHETLGRLLIEHSKLYSETENWLPTDIVIITGLATGADRAACDFAVCSYCQIKEFPADWEKHGRAAGPIRNQQMLDEGKPDLVVAFPGGKGTADMVRRSKKAGIKVIEVAYDPKSV